MAGADEAKQTGVLSFVALDGSTARVTTPAASVPREVPEIAAPPRRARPARREPTRLAPRTLAPGDAIRELGLVRWLRAPASSFTAEQRVLVYDGDLVIDRLDTRDARHPHSVVVRGDLEVDGLEWAADDTTCFLLVEGSVTARYAWLAGSSQVRIARDLLVEDVLVATGDGDLEIRGALTARAILQQGEHTITTRRAPDALVAGGSDQVDAVTYDDPAVLVVRAAVSEDELDPAAVRKLLRAGKPVLRDRLPRP